MNGSASDFAAFCEEIRGVRFGRLTEGQRAMLFRYFMPPWMYARPDAPWQGYS